MKKWIMSAAMLCSIGAFAQNTTNVEGSHYQFTVLKNLEAGNVQNQGNTGTCWSFSGLSFFESELLRNSKYKGLNLSEMYVVRKMYPLKAANFVRMHGKANFGEGGGFPDDLLCLRKYGMVPQSVYDGNKVKTYNHAEMEGLLEGMVTKIGNAQGSINPEWSKALDGVLNAYMGDAPEKFQYDGKTYTPQSFAKELGLNADDYVIISSFTHHPYYSQFVLEVPDNWNWERVYNVPLDEFTNIAENAVMNGYSIAWAADVSEKGFNFRQGLAIVPEKDWTDMSPAVVISISLVLILATNLLSVRWFGESEVVAGAIKIACFLGLILVSIVITSGGAPNGETIGFRYWNNPRRLGGLQRHLRTNGSLPRILGLFCQRSFLLHWCRGGCYHRC
jgi:bleomycin hydrolase